MRIPALLLLASCVPSHAFDRLPAESQALVNASLTLRARSIGAFRRGGVPSGLDEVFSTVGRSGRVASETGSSFSGTYTMRSVSPTEVSFQLSTNILSGRVTVTFTGPGAARLRFAGTAYGFPVDISKVGAYTYDPATRTGTISHDGATETFAARDTGMRAVISGTAYLLIRGQPLAP